MIQETSKELIMDPLFCNRLDKALNDNEPVSLFLMDRFCPPSFVVPEALTCQRVSQWLRDAFGVILRLYALVVDGDIQVPTIYSQRLHQCVERAFDTLKGECDWADAEPIVLG